MNLATDFLYAFIRVYREFYLYASSSAEWEIGYIKRSVIIYYTSLFGHCDRINVLKEICHLIMYGLV